MLAPSGILAYFAGQAQKVCGNAVARAVAFINPAALTTAGAGTLTAALLQPGNLIQRTGPTGAFADTLDTGANMTAAYPEIEIGQSFKVKYSIRVAYVGTLTAATGMTAVSGSTVAIPASSTVDIILTRTGTSTWTFET